MAYNISAIGDRLDGSVTATGSTGTIAFLFTPNWSSGDSTTHLLARLYVDTLNFIDCQKFLDNNFYVGWYLNGSPDCRVAISDAGLFTSGTPTSIQLTWNDATPKNELFVGGVSKGTNGNAFTAGAANTIRLGHTTSAANGHFAEYGYWNAVLNTSELAALAQGFSPKLIRPASLVAHYSLVRELTSVKSGGGILTATGTPAVSAHPRVINPRRHDAMRRITVVATPSTRSSNLLMMGV